MILNEQGFWRIVISIGAGAVAAVVASLVAVVWSIFRREVNPVVPATAGISVTIAAYAIDWLSERRSG